MIGPYNGTYIAVSNTSPYLRRYDRIPRDLEKGPGHPKILKPLQESAIGKIKQRQQQRYDLYHVVRKLHHVVHMLYPLSKAPGDFKCLSEYGT